MKTWEVVRLVRDAQRLKAMLTARDKSARKGQT